MKTTTATGTLCEAWAGRYERAAETLQHAEAAPALFKPEYVEELQADAAKAGAEYRYWLMEDMGR